MKKLNLILSTNKNNETLPEIIITNPDALESLTKVLNEADPLKEYHATTIQMLENDEEIYDFIQSIKPDFNKNDEFYSFLNSGKENWQWEQ